MIAYNHYIKFIPALRNDKRIEGSFSNVVTVKESFAPELEIRLHYKLIFFNNQGRDLSLLTDREFSRTIKSQLWTFEIKNVLTFFWHSGTLTLEYIKHNNYTEALLEYWCLHIVLPVFFTIEENYSFLHAGAVELNGKAILFIAESFGGKSTLTDFFIKQGHTMISDDKVATYEQEEKFFATPSHPHHRPYRKMEDLGFFVENFATKPSPIQTIYKLDKVAADNAVIITELKGQEKFIPLSYASEINLFFQKQTCFVSLMKIINTVPVFNVTVPWNMDRLNEVYSAICKHNISIGIIN